MSGLSASASAIKSIQTGYVDGLPNTGTGEDALYLDVTVSAVDVSKSVIIITRSAAGADTSSYRNNVRLLNSVTVRISGFSGYTSVGLRWQLLEYL